MKHPLFQSLSAVLLLLALCACTAASPDQTPNPPPETADSVETEPVLVERDWSAFFQGMRGDGADLWRGAFPGVPAGAGGSHGV